MGGASDGVVDCGVAGSDESSELGEAREQEFCERLGGRWRRAEALGVDVETRALAAAGGVGKVETGDQ